MRALALVISSSAVLTYVAGQALFSGSPQPYLDTPVVAACSVQSGGCHQPPLDGVRQSLVSHTVLTGACTGADLHIMRYAAGETGRATLVATWCY